MCVAHHTYFCTHTLTHTHTHSSHTHTHIHTHTHTHTHTDVEVALQTQLLNKDNANTELDDIFLRMFAEVAGEQWPSLAALLSHTVQDIEAFEREQHPALCMLRGWKQSTSPTYGHLLSVMKAPFLLPGYFQRLKPQPQVQLPSNFGKCCN